MGWKTSMIFANSEKEVDLDALFASMGIYQLTKVDSELFDLVMNPKDEKIYIGKHNGNTIICMQDIPLESLDIRMSRAETALSEAFDNADVVTFVLHSVVNLWGYSVVENGKKIRVRAGSSDGGTMIEFGDILPEEKGLMSQSQIDENGQRIFTLDGHPEYEYSEDQIGESFVFNISAKYFGEALDCSDDLFETSFDGYTFSTSRPNPVEPPIEPKMELKKVAKPWWKFR